MKNTLKHIYDFKLKGESKDNEIFFLEVNGQVCFHPDGAFVIAGKTKNYSYSDIICHIIDFAYNNIRKQCVIGGIHG
jgi:hypothetical protein